MVDIEAVLSVVGTDEVARWRPMELAVIVSLLGSVFEGAGKEDPDDALKYYQRVRWYADRLTDKALDAIGR